MNRVLTLSACATAAILVAGTFAAQAAPTIGDIVGTTEAEIRSNLERQGYEVEEIESEDGVFEAEVEKDDKELEIEIDAATGKITAMELDD